MINDSESDDSGSDNEFYEGDKVKLDPVKAEHLKNGFTFSQTVSSRNQSIQ